VEINAAIAKHTATLDRVEKEFAAFAHERAEKLAPALEWDKPKFKEMSALGPAVPKVKPFILPGTTNSTEPESALERLLRKRAEEAGASVTNKSPILLAPPKPAPRPPPTETAEESVTDWIAKHPANFYALMQQGKKFIDDKKWQEAKAPLQKLLDAYPGYVGAGNAYVMLASAHRGLNETNAERAVLTKLGDRTADDLDAFLRLMELADAAQDWPTVELNAKRFLAVNPLVPQPYRYLARAAEELKQTKTAIDACQSLLLLDPPDPADVHFRLAKMMKQTGDPAAKRHVLMALEEAPRFREAHRLLLEINQQMARNQTPPAGVQPPKP